MVCNGLMPSLSNMSEKQIKKLKDEFSIHVGKQVRKVRESKGMTQEQLSERAGFYRTYVGHIENGTYSPSLFTIWRIAKALGVKVESLTKNL